MPMRAVETHRLYRQIADQLSTLIAAGEFAESARRPSERDLATRLGVSLPSLREALIALEIDGKVEVRVGAGIYVTAPLPGAADRTSEGPGPFELLRARWLIEGEITAEAARRGTPADIGSIVL
jgi:DNA-binding FadR family transcriptional regulator